MRLLHTSDWHLGRVLCSKKDRQEEHTLFLEWLLNAIEEHSIDLLIVAGDIFDTTSPSSGAQKMYYDFLTKVRKTRCQNVVIIAGNHDSPSFINAPKNILEALNVSVVGNTSQNAEDEVIVIKDINKHPVAIVCAVPFLRERDINRYYEGETYRERSNRIIENTKKHFHNLAQIAESKRAAINKKIPVITTGHLSVAGGKTTGNDGVRDAYVGDVKCVGTETFSPVFDYVALGHYHISSSIGKTIHYSGSPMPMGFGEANQKKIVYIVEFEEQIPKITPLEVPVFQKLETICGDKLFIHNRLTDLIKTDKSVWVEIIYDGDDVFPNFSVWANEIVANSKIEIIRLQNRQFLDEALIYEENIRLLDELDEFEVFEKILEKNNFSAEQTEDLKNLYREITIEISDHENIKP